MISVSSDNAIVAVIVAVLFFVLGGGARSFFLSLRRDRRRGRVDDVELLDAVRRVARSEVRRMERRLLRESKQRERVEGYVETLRSALSRNGITPPPWPPELPPEPEDDEDEEG